jgi:prepilin-type N-terminal cleavage/methylation domain-containing protein
MAAMTNLARNTRGFTLLEIIVVLAVLGALAAALSVVVFRYIDDSNRARAQGDVRAIAVAIRQMYADTGRYPYFVDGTRATRNHGPTDALFLTSSASCNANPAPTGGCDTTRPTAAGGTGWPDLTSWRVQSLTSQLNENDPAYATTGTTAWRGPYLREVPAVDPWGRSYLVNIINANPATPTSWVVVVSAGPDGILQTMHSGVGAGLTENPAVGGDDVIFRVK